MELKEAKNFISRHTAYLADVSRRADIARRYYKLQNDITCPGKKTEKDAESVLRHADNRVPSGYYPLLVNQKAAYMFTYPPLFDVGNKKSNLLITKVLGDKYGKNCQKLCVSASNCGVAWLHYWQDKNGVLRWGVIDGTQVIPIVGNELDGEIYSVIRSYRIEDETDAKTYVVYEIWNDKECEVFRRPEHEELVSGLQYYDVFNVARSINDADRTNCYRHPFERVPFIPFANNDQHTTDLEKIKGLIDTYDKTYNGFANDLEDIQEVIMILTGYSGTDLGEFLADLKKYKVLKLDDKESGGAQTLNIEIPVEARETMLKLTRKAIFTEGAGR